MKLNKKLILLTVNIILLSYLIYRLFDASRMLQFFPLHNPTDISTYMARLFWFDQYGYGAFISNWYGGFYVLKSYWPLWFFIALPFYKLTGCLTAASYVSGLTIIVVTFILALYFAKKIKLSKLEMLFILLVTFVNPYASGNLFKLWRAPEILGLGLFVLSFMYIMYLEQRKFKLDWKQFSILFIIMALTLLSYGAYFIFLCLVLLGIYLKYRNQNILLLIVLPALVTLPLWYNIFTGTFFNQLYWITRADKLALLLFIPLFWFMCYVQYSNKKPLRRYIFPMILGIPLILGIGKYLPVVSSIRADAYTYFFIFLSAVILVENLKTDFKFKKLILLALIPLAISFIFAAEVISPHTGFEPNDELDDEILGLLPYVSDKVIIAEPGGLARSGAFYSYGAIYYNTSTASGLFFELEDRETLDTITKLELQISEQTCEDIKGSLIRLDNPQIIAYDDCCEVLDQCTGLSEIKSLKRACLYTLDT